MAIGETELWFTSIALFRTRGVHRLFLKRLAHNDNEKNQIYLGPSLDGLAGTLGAQMSGVPGIPRYWIRNRSPRLCSSLLSRISGPESRRGIRFICCETCSLLDGGRSEDLPVVMLTPRSRQGGWRAGSHRTASSP